MILGITGHRHLIHPEHIVYAYAKRKIVALSPAKIITGMALGFDTICAQIAVQLHIPFIAATPCDDQSKPWTPQQNKVYYDLLAKAEEIVNVSPGDYSARKMFIRDEWIIDHSDMILAYYDGRNRGGTKHTIEYAINQKKSWVNLMPLAQHVSNTPLM